MFKLPVLLYHNVIDEGCDITAVSRYQFVEQIQFLRDLGYQTISTSEAIELFQAKIPIKKTSLVIHFDDGYSDTYETAFSILEKQGYSATVYVLADYIGCMNTWDTRVDQKLHHLSLSQIKLLVQGGWDIGSHTRSHTNLRKLSEDELSTEFFLSRVYLEHLFNLKVNSVSYPYGAYNQRIEEIASKYYDVAFSVLDGDLDWETKQFAIKRFLINRTTSFQQIEDFLRLCAGE